MKTKKNLSVNTPLLGRGWGRLFILLAFIGLSNLHAQVGIGTTSPKASSILDVESTTQGFLPPRMETSDRDAIPSPAEGLTIFNITSGCLEFYNGALWVSACDGALQPGPLTDCAPGFIAPYITADQTQIVDVTSPQTNRIWMDRNLGAITKARAIDDCYAYGNLHQWGRGNDGHESRTSSGIPGPVTTSYVGDAFVSYTSTSTFDWLTPQDDSRWNSGTEAVPVKVVNNDPCPTGYRVPTNTEFRAELQGGSQTSLNLGFSSFLKISGAGERSCGGNPNCITQTGQSGRYWTSTPTTNGGQGGADGGARAILFGPLVSIGSQSIVSRGVGYSVRCIKKL